MSIMRLLVMATGVGALLTSMYIATQREVEAAPKGIPLKAGQNEVTYLGPTQPIAAALASIAPYVQWVWWWDSTTWRIYQPGAPSDFDTMVTGQTYQVYVTQDCLWTEATRTV